MTRGLFIRGFGVRVPGGAPSIEALHEAAATAAEVNGAVEFSGFVKMRYGLADASAELSSVVASVAPFAKGHPGGEAYHELMHKVLPVVVSVKHPSFVEEQEWRLLMLTWGAARSVQFRTSRLGLIPFRTVPLPERAITAVVIGPGDHPAVRRSGVAQLLESLDLREIEIRDSASPLRL